jgi:hypothetical protein
MRHTRGHCKLVGASNRQIEARLYFWKIAEPSIALAALAIGVP